MKKNLIILFFILFQGQSVFAQELRQFLKSCAWGTLAGAGAGVVSLAFTDKPSESWNNVARGASLGLYGGIIYGLYQVNKEPPAEGQVEFVMMPSFDRNGLEGVHVTGTVFSF